jgi:hypothetical protein
MSSFLSPISPAGTPGRFLELPLQSPSLAASFENLVALANYQERIKDARKIVWRDKGQPVVELRTLRDCLEHAAAGGLSACLPFLCALFLTFFRIGWPSVQYSRLF